MNTHRNVETSQGSEFLIEGESFFLRLSHQDSNLSYLQKWVQLVLPTRFLASLRHWIESWATELVQAVDFSVDRTFTVH